MYRLASFRQLRESDAAPTHAQGAGRRPLSGVLLARLRRSGGADFDPTQTSVLWHSTHGSVPLISKRDLTTPSKQTHPAYGFLHLT